MGRKRTDDSRFQKTAGIRCGFQFPHRPRPCCSVHRILPRMNRYNAKGCANIKWQEAMHSSLCTGKQLASRARSDASGSFTRIFVGQTLFPFAGQKSVCGTPLCKHSGLLCRRGESLKWQQVQTRVRNSRGLDFRARVVPNFVGPGWAWAGPEPARTLHIGLSAVKMSNS